MCVIRMRRSYFFDLSISQFKLKSFCDDPTDFDDDTQCIIWHNLLSSANMKMLGHEREEEGENKQIKNISQS